MQELTKVCLQKGEFQALILYDKNCEQDNWITDSHTPHLYSLLKILPFAVSKY